MFESYLLTTDGKEYVDANSVREALGIIDEYVDILGVIKKLKEERDGLKADLELTNRLYKEDSDFVDKVCEAVDIQRPYLESSYDRTVKLIAEIKRERDELKDDNDLLEELHANHISQLNDYAELAFELGIGSGDAESLKDYIVSLKKERDGLKRDKKLGIIESVDYQNAKAARAKLAYLYKTVLGKERLDRDLSPHEVMKAILDEYKRREEFIRELSCSLGFGDPIVNPDNIYQKEKDILERVEKLKDGVWPCENSSTFAEYLRKEFPKLCERYGVAPLNCTYPRGGSVHDWIQYIFKVLADYRTLANDIFNKAEGFRNEKRAVEDSLAELRAKIREIYRSTVDDEWDESLGYTTALNDINEEYNRVVHNFEERTADWSKVRQEFDRYKLAVGSLCSIPAEHRDDISWIEDSFNHTKKDYLKWQTKADKLARFRSNICTALCLGGETRDEDILERVRKTRECHDKLARLRSNICSEFSLVPENCDGNIIGHIHMMQDCLDKLREFRDAVAEAIGITYPTTNNFLLTRVSDIYKERGEAHDLAMELDRKCIDLTAKNSELQQKFEFQSGLRQQWHVRYESEHERANGVQKALDREREKCRVKNISLETAKKQYEKVCGNLETAECAINGMKSKVRELREEKTKVISALGQDIWDDCLK